MKVFGKAILLMASVSSSYVFSQESLNQIQLDAVEVKDTHLDGGFNVKLTSDDLANKNNQNLGSLLNGELGVSTTGYGAGASRPVLRGLDGTRVQVLENGQSISDVSAISADHAVANTMGQIKEIEILRGPTALAYGSGVVGGIINIINNRIAKTPHNEFIADVDMGYETANDRKVSSVNLGASSNSIIWRLDANTDHAENYKIPGYAELKGPSAGWSINTNSPQDVPYANRLPLSYNKQDSVGLGVSYVAPSGYTGISIDQIKHDYGVPTVEGSQIHQYQTRLNVEHLTKKPWNGVNALRINFSANDYRHDELDAGNVTQTHWTNRGLGGKIELEHEPWHSIQGRFGAQASTSKLQAIDSSSGDAAIVPSTKTDSTALYWIEESKINALKISGGARYEFQSLNPNKNTSYAGNPPDFSPINTSYSPSPIINRQFGLLSYSMLADWSLGSGYGTSLGHTRSQRAPSAVELYGYGSHDSTATFIVGNSNLKPENSNSIELKFYKSAGLFQTKTNLYWIYFNNYIYGMNTGSYSRANNNFSVVTTNQAPASIKGIESELSYFFADKNLLARFFGDMTRGTFDFGGYLPLQPAPRLGLELKHELNQTTTQLTYLHSFTQNRLANFEIGQTPAYNLLNINISYKQRIENSTWTSYIKVTNLLNQDIRYSTTPETIRLYAPQMARSVLVGVRLNY